MELLQRDGESFRGYEWKNSGEARSGWTRLPLLWNVITGDMSLVGMPLQRAGTSPESPLYFKPGLISLWQLESGEAREMRQYNQYYMQHYSLTLDVQLVFRALFQGSNGQVAG